MNAPPAWFITQPPRTLDGWAASFDPAALPVLNATAAELEVLRAAEDRVDAHLLAETLGADPLLTLKVLAHVGSLARRRGRECSDAETLTEALVLLGITPFFSAFGPQPSVGERLAARPEAMAGLQRVLRRADRAARFAMAFAVHRMDHDAAVIHEAALLHDFTELLLWLHAPDLALEIRRRQCADPALRSAAAQQAVMNITLAQLQHRLMNDWHLPALLVHISDDGAAAQGWRDNTQLRNVQLAIRVARHSAEGWDNAALPDDIAEIADLLRMAPEPTRRLLLDIDEIETPAPAAG